MRPVNLPDHVFIVAERAAKLSGYASVEEYVSFLVTEGDHVDESFFTKERLEQIDAALEQVDSGKVVSVEDLDAEIAAKSKVWRETRAA
jgi:hypothetical protein